MVCVPHGHNMMYPQIHAWPRWGKFKKKLLKRAYMDEIATSLLLK